MLEPMTVNPQDDNKISAVPPATAASSSNQPMYRYRNVIPNNVEGLKHPSNNTNRSSSTRCTSDTKDVSSPIQLNDNSYYQKSTLQKYDYRRPIVGPNG